MEVPTVLARICHRERALLKRNLQAFLLVVEGTSICARGEGSATRSRVITIKTAYI
jgi:hypothetical protein